MITLLIAFYNDKYDIIIHTPASGYPLRHSSQFQGERANKSLGRNPTIKISRATRVSEQWNASLDREITNANELRHLDEFLGNQVHMIDICCFLYLGMKCGIF